MMPPPLVIYDDDPILEVRMNGKTVVPTAEYITAESSWSTSDRPDWYGKMPTKAVPLTDAWIALRTKERLERAGGRVYFSPTREVSPWLFPVLIGLGFIGLCIGAAIYGAMSR